jgi:Uma2 family endonuclease
VLVEEYLSRSYPDGDREFLDGVVLERNLGSVPHSALLATLSFHFGQHEKRLGLAVYPSCRLRVGETRYRVPDICVMLRPFRRDRRALVDVPFVIVEILEREEMPDQMLRRCADYAALGVPQIILMDPEARETFVYSGGALTRQDVTGFDIPERGVLPFDSCSLFAELDYS